MQDKKLLPMKSYVQEVTIQFYGVNLRSSLALGLAAINFRMATNINIITYNAMKCMTGCYDIHNCELLSLRSRKHTSVQKNMAYIKRAHFIKYIMVGKIKEDGWWNGRLTNTHILLLTQTQWIILDRRRPAQHCRKIG